MSNTTVRPPEVETEDGPLRGVLRDGVVCYLGVPYARPPLGELRFAAPRPLARRTEPHDATEPGAAAPQPGSFRAHLMQGTVTRQSEDALWLNIWVPQNRTGPCPVLVWIHGGAFTNGSAGLSSIDGARLAAAASVVVVTVNYRLGALGFAYHPELTDPDEANPGLLDQAAALSWVHREIAAFGGDPTRITLGGESAGAIGAAILARSGIAHGLFAQLILHSGVAKLQSAAASATSTELLARELRLRPSQLRNVPDQVLVATALTLGLRFWPTTAGPFDADRTQRLDLPMLVTTAADEGTFLMLDGPEPPTFTPATALGLLRQLHAGDGDIASRASREEGAALRVSLSDHLTQSLFDRPADAWCAEVTAEGSAVYRGKHRWRTPLWGGWLGATHTLEIPLIFDTWMHPQLARLYEPASRAQEAATRLQQQWSDFLHHASPGRDWPRWTPDIRHVAELGGKLEARPGESRS